MKRFAVLSMVLLMMIAVATIASASQESFTYTNVNETWTVTMAWWQDADVDATTAESAVICPTMCGTTAEDDTRPTMYDATYLKTSGNADETAEVTYPTKTVDMTTLYSFDTAGYIWGSDTNQLQVVKDIFIRTNDGTIWGGKESHDIPQISKELFLNTGENLITGGKMYASQTIFEGTNGFTRKTEAYHLVIDARPHGMDALEEAHRTIKTPSVAESVTMQATNDFVMGSVVLM